MKNIEKIISRFPKANILVIGDLILDEYIWGTVERISPEAPVPVVWARLRSFMPGGAANVASNISSLGAGVTLVGAVGKDKNASVLLSEIRKKKINTAGIIAQPKRHTTVKTRIIAGHQQVVRVDWEHTDHITDPKVINFIRKNIGKFDAVIIEDYGKGLINPVLLKEVVALAKAKKKIITVDPKEEHFEYYRDVTCITPNRKETENAIRRLKIKDKTNRFKIDSDKLFSDHDVDLAGRQILKYLNLDSILVTLGEQGMRLFEKTGKITHIPTVAQKVFDVSGAGDTVIATFTLALAAGAKKIEAAHIANFAAGIVVGKIGVATTTRKELIERIRS